MPASYEFYRTVGLEWFVHALLIADGLYLLCDGRQGRIPRWLFDTLSGLFCLALVPITRLMPYVPVFSTQGSAVWFFFVAVAAATLGMAALFLRQSFKSCVGYDVFYIVLLLLWKMICSPLYSRERQLPPGLYIGLDLALTGLLWVLLIMMTTLFFRVRMDLRLSDPPKSLALAYLFPVSFFVYYFLYATGMSLNEDLSRAVLCLIILLNLPIMYYISATVLQGYNDKVRLDRALQRSKTELERYRFSEELDRQIKQERHELKNNYFYIQMLLKEGRYADIDDYLTREIGERIESLEAVSTGNAMLDYILTQKIAEARAKGIQVFTEIAVQDRLPVAEGPLCTVLLNLLNNAMEACAGQEQADLRITVRQVQGYLLLKITNPVTVDPTLANPGLETTKADRKRHGFGLKVLRSTVASQSGTFQTTVADGRFQATVMLPTSQAPESRA